MMCTKSVVLAFCSAVLFGHWAAGQSIRANIRGGGDAGRGKCTAEVEVDGVAEVGIRGDTGQIQTISGNPARWRRLVCTGAMPRNFNEFRFRGIDGRGRQELIRDPRRSGGLAVVRIEDPKGGSEGYTFDIEWSEGGSWGGASGDRVEYRGRRRGWFEREGGQRYAVHGVDVLINRGGGDVRVILDSDLGPDALRFTGRVSRTSGMTVYADVRSGSNRGETAGASGEMRIELRSDRGVRSIRMDGRLAGGRFRLSWDD